MYGASFLSKARRYYNQLKKTGGAQHPAISIPRFELEQFKRTAATYMREALNIQERRRKYRKEQIRR
jgi:hypothetical protein